MTYEPPSHALRSISVRELLDDPHLGLNVRLVGGAAGLGLGSDGNARQPAKVLLQIEASVEAPLVGGEVAICVLSVEALAGAHDCALEIAETDVDPFEERRLGTAAAGHDRKMLHDPQAGKPALRTTTRRCAPSGSGPGMI